MKNYGIVGFKVDLVVNVGNNVGVGIGVGVGEGGVFKYDGESVSGCCCVVGWW